jgi:hypothetical protein
MTTPAEELQGAAHKLRTLTIDVTPAPWRVHNPNGYPQAVYGDASNSLFCEVLDDIDQPKPHAPYIAAMHPGVALAVADWLESAAEDAEQIGPDPHAVAVARAINGGEQQ